MAVPQKTVFVVLNLAGGGAERVVVNLLAGLAKSLAPGTLEVVQLSRGEDAFGAAKLGIPIIRFDASRLARAIPPLVAYFRRARPDVVVSHLTAANIATSLALRLAGSRAKHVAVAHLSYDDDVFASMSLGWLRKLAARRTYGSSATVIAVSQGVADSVRNYLGVVSPPARVIYNPIFRPEIDELATRPVDESWLPAGTGPLLLNIGRLTPQKDQATLLKAVAIVRRNTPVRLLILGEGPERVRLEAEARTLGISDAVSLPGFSCNPFAYLARADLFVLSSVREGLPSVLIEALALGCPVVSTDCRAGPGEILEGGRFGRLVPPGDPERLAVAIREAAAESPSRDALRRRGRSFSVEAAVQAYAAAILG